MLASGSGWWWDGSKGPKDLKLWNAADGFLMHELTQNNITNVCFSPVENILVASAPLTVWNVDGMPPPPSPPTRTLCSPLASPFNIKFLLQYKRTSSTKYYSLCSLKSYLCSPINSIPILTCTTISYIKEDSNTGRRFLPF